MKLSIYRNIGILSLLIGFFVGPAVTSAAEEKGFQDLTLKVVVAKQQFLTLEPLTLTLVLENTTRAPIKAHNGLCLNCERFDVYRGLVGQPRTKIPELSGVRVFQSIPEHILYPGETIEERILFDMDLHQNFPESAPYTLQVVLWDRKKQISIASKPVTFVIREPQGINHLALKHLESITEGQPGGYWISGTIEQHEEFMLLFRDSIYAPYVADYLAVYHSRNADKAVEYASFMANRTDYPWADKALSDLFDVHQRLGHKKQAEQIVIRLKQEHPKSAFTNPFQDDGSKSPALKQYLKAVEER